MHIIGSFLFDLTPALSVSSSSFAPRSVVPFFFQLPLLIYCPLVRFFYHSPSSLDLFMCFSLSKALCSSIRPLPWSHHSFSISLTDRQVHVPTRGPPWWMGRGSWGGGCLMSPGCVSARLQRSSAQWRELKLEQVPAALLRVVNRVAATCVCAAQWDGGRTTTGFCCVSSSQRTLLNKLKTLQDWESTAPVYHFLQSSKLLRMPTLFSTRNKKKLQSNTQLDYLNCMG